VWDAAQIKLGDSVNVSVRAGRIIVEPLPKIRGSYDLKKLVSKIPRDFRTEEVDWGPLAGKEVW
jgi:antitoxin MazE